MNQVLLRNSIKYYLFYAFRRSKTLASKYCKERNAPPLTKNERNEIKEYWSQYGIRIRDFSWWQMYYHVTKKHDVRFVPDPVAGFILYPYYNEQSYIRAWKDKNYFDRFLPEVPLPETVCKRIRGRYFWEGAYHSQNDTPLLSDFLLAYAKRECCDLIVKPTRDTGMGRGVKKYSLSSKKDAEILLEEWKDVRDYIVQKRVIQHETMASFNPDSTNMIRVFSWRHDNAVDIVFATIRAGVPGHVTDVAYIDGVETLRLVNVSPDGTIGSVMLDENGAVVRELEANRKLPGWDRIVEIVKANHLYMDNFDLIGWDFTIDKDGSPVCFEWNISWPGAVFYQYVNGPLLREYTDGILDFLKEKRNQKKYIPFPLRKR